MNQQDMPVQILMKHHQEAVNEILRKVEEEVCKGHVFELDPETLTDHGIPDNFLLPVARVFQGLKFRVTDVTVDIPVYEISV